MRMYLKAELAIRNVSDTVSRIMTSAQFAWVLLPLLVLWEGGVLVQLAARKLFWYDELLTLHFSTLQPFSRFLQALQAGTDGMPAGYYFIVRLVNLWSGDPRFTLRLPSILGYTLTLLSVYWFVRARLTVAASLTAVLLVTLSPFRWYAIEARSYALLVGFLAISAVLWQRIDERPLMKPLLALSLGLCVASHYYAVIATSAVAVAELAWTLMLRR